MPYGTPAAQEQSSKYDAHFTHTNGAFVNLSSAVSPFGDVSDFDDAYQAALDALAGSPDFTLTEGAAKTYPTTEEITPTP
jgi:hypothetical protein